MKKARGKAPAMPKPGLSEPPTPGFAIVGIGASAGGLEAFEQFFRNTPPDTGIGFVLVPHLDPGHGSLLSEILQRATTMLVVEAQDQMRVLPNQVHVIPPNRDMLILGGVLQVSLPQVARGHRMPIDLFFRSLADDRGEAAIGIVLSGTGMDGTLGLRAILGAGGASFVQAPASARYDGMPASAIHAHLATCVSTPEDMPLQLLGYLKAMGGRSAKGGLPVASGPAALSPILLFLRSKTGHDFSLYKPSTIGRRIDRRAAVHDLELPAYARYLQDHPEEVRLLFKELLINVTSFFRDKDVFETLEKVVLPELFEGKPEGYGFRIWVPGCATGEEAYSIAIAFREHMERARREHKVQIYATDIDEDVITVARAGLYPPNIALDVSEERLRRFFYKEEAGFRIRKPVREMVVFATHNLLKDPPFTKLDLLSCRNLLIYLEPELQNRVVPAFHYALRPSGVLLLSPSEGIGNHTDLFAPLHRKSKFFRSKPSSASARAVLAGRMPWAREPAPLSADPAPGKPRDLGFTERTKKALLDSYAPPAVVTDYEGTVLYVHGDTGRYLRAAPGQASLNVVLMAREGLQHELRRAIQRAIANRKAVTLKDLAVKFNRTSHRVRTTVRPLPGPDPLLLVSFEDSRGEPEPPAGRTKAARSLRGTRQVREIEEELQETRASLQATIEEAQAANEELKSANEELQSTNEELQSTNEELETSKEELQSVNEELVTVNSELQAKIEQLARTQSDLRNLLDNTSAGAVFLDGALAIRRFTRDASRLFRLVASDVGRPLADIKPNVEGHDLLEDAREVLDSLVPRQRQVSLDGGRLWYLARIVPYRTVDNVIDGVVFTFADITDLKSTEAALRDARNYAESIVDSVRDPLVILDSELQVVSAGRSFYRAFDLNPQQTVGRTFSDLCGGRWKSPKLVELLAGVLARGQGLEDVQVEEEPSGGAHPSLWLTARPLPGRFGEHAFILVMLHAAATPLPPGSSSS
jgi:two-component system, chemotaxis family, CheB/CheR fusion protein